MADQKQRRTLGAMIVGALARILPEGTITTEQEPVESLTRAPAAPASTAKVSAEARTIAGRRVSYDRPEDQWVSPLNIFTQASGDTYWRGLKLDQTTLDRAPLSKVVELLMDVSPEVSSALWYLVLMGNPGFSCKAVRPGTTEPDQRGTDALNEVRATLKRLHGSEDVIYNGLFISLFARGAICSELVLADNVRDFVDLACPDPASLAFRKVPDPIRRAVWQVGQWQGGKFVPLDLPTFQYIPLHPLPGEIRGRPLVSPAVFTAIFLLVVLHDLRRVIANQGYPRIDVEVDFDKLLAVMPTEIQGDPTEVKAWADAVIEAVKAAYGKLKPDDTYVHSSVVKVNKPVGTLNSSSLGAIDGMFKAIERMLTRALKTMPLNMATTDGVSEANANRQWELFAASIKSLQHMVESMIEAQFDLALQAQGIPAKTLFRFSEIRASEEQRDAQTQQTKLNNAMLAYKLGYWSQDEAAMYAVGKEKADQQVPRVALGTAQPGQQPPDLVPEPGSNRQPPAHRNGHDRVRSPSIAQIEGGAAFWAMHAPDEARELPFAESGSEH